MNADNSEVARQQSLTELWEGRAANAALDASRLRDDLTAQLTENALLRDELAAAKEAAAGMVAAARAVETLNRDKVQGLREELATARALACITYQTHYTDRDGTAWYWLGQRCDSEQFGQVPVLHNAANGHAPGDFVLASYGPLEVAS